MSNILPPDAFEDIPDGWCWSSEPDDDREEHEFPEFDEFAESVWQEQRHADLARFAELFEICERGAA